MSKKSRRRTARAETADTEPSAGDIERRAREDLAAGRYRNAVEGFKQLLKQDPRPAWRTALAEAYAGRARELAAKDMLKEALAIWDNRASLGTDVDFDADWAVLLLRMGKTGAILERFLAGPTARRPEQETERECLRPFLAAAFVAGDTTLATRLPADEPVVLHGPAAREALAAYCAGEDDKVQAALAAIPFRSPYRDLVQILKALQRAASAPDEAAALLARVGADSAFRSMHRAAALALVPEADFVAALRAAGLKAARFACTLRGWSAARIALWEEAERLGREPSAEVRLRFMIRHAEAIGANWVRRRGLRLLAGDLAACRRQLKAAGARPLNQEESLLLAAWDAERREYLIDEFRSWEGYAEHLRATNPTAAPGQGTDEDLRIALALRRCDQHGILDREPAQDPDDAASLVVAQLEKSLVWDPDDRATYLRLVGYYRRRKDLKNVRRLLKEARGRWPKDTKVIAAELDTALDAGSFKKAAGLAREILVLDGINSGVRERLVQAHLAHARKQVASRRCDLARKEVAAAKEWARGKAAQERIEVAAAFIDAIDDPKQGDATLGELYQRLGAGLDARLMLALAGQDFGISPKRLERLLKWPRGAAVARDELAAAFARLRAHLEGGGKVTRELGDFLARSLGRAPFGELAKAEAERACDTLRRLQLHEVRLAAATAALKRFPGVPLLELHAFEAKYPYDRRRSSREDRRRLERASDRASEEGDVQTAMRIDEILEAIAAPSFEWPHQGEVPPPEAIAQALRFMIETEGLPAVLDQIGLAPEARRPLEALARDSGPEAAAKALSVFIGMFLEDMDDEEDDELPIIIPARKPPRRKGRRRASKTAGERAPGADDDQLDLF